MENNSKKATFIERFFAYVVDIVIITIIVTMLAYPFTANKTDDIEKISNEMTELLQKYTDDEVSMDTYVIEYSTLSYQLDKYQGATVLIGIFIYILYFMVFQFYNKGQTIGKKLLKIKVKSIDSELTMNQVIIRALLIDSILASMVQIVVLSFVSDANSYFYINGIFMIIDFIFVVISALMIMFSKNRRGLHDYITKTEVVKI